MKKLFFSLKNVAILTLVCLLVFLFSSDVSYPEDPNSKTLAIWALSDIQPRNHAQRIDFAQAVEDINENLPGIDIAIVAGDIVHSANADDYEWYLSVRGRSYIKEWHEIAGNHDLKGDTGGRLYRKYVNSRTNYSFTKGNVLFILMSDEEKGSPTEISDETFLWWKKLVEDNQDKIIVVVTHAPLEGSGIPLSDTRRRQILHSERFREVLEKYTVDLWLSGHVHVPQWFAGDIGRVPSLGGTVFVNAAAIRREAFGLKPPESRIIIFTCGSREVQIRSRNHRNSSFTESLDRTYRLSKPYICESQ
ncbi:MAG: metallophosphoesterase [Candidatus Methanosuratincola sp.]